MTTREITGACYLVAARDEGLVAASPAGRAALRAAIASTRDFPGATGNITIGPDRDAIKPGVVTRVDEAGPRFVAAVGP